MRIFKADRTVMNREIIKVSTEYGDIRIKKNPALRILLNMLQNMKIVKRLLRNSIYLRDAYREALKGGIE